MTRRQRPKGRTGKRRPRWPRPPVSRRTGSHKPAYYPRGGYFPELVAPPELAPGEPAPHKADRAELEDE